MLVSVQIVSDPARGVEAWMFSGLAASCCGLKAATCRNHYCYGRCPLGFPDTKDIAPYWIKQCRPARIREEGTTFRRLCASR